MNEIESKPLNLASGNIVRAVLANDEIRARVRERLRAEGKLPHYTPEKMASIVKAFLAEEEARKNGVQEIEPGL